MTLITLYVAISLLLCAYLVIETRRCRDMRLNDVGMIAIISTMWPIGVPLFILGSLILALPGLGDADRQ